MTSLNLYDPARPQDGATITGQEMRSLLSALATHSAGTVPPGGDAILISDNRISTVSASARYLLDMEINGVSKIVDIRSAAGNIGAVTPANIVSAINTAFASLGTVAYVYNPETYDGTAFIALVAPRATNTKITIREAAGGTDASELVFGFQGRVHGMPYEVTPVARPYGLTWLQQINGDDDALSIYLGSPARATGLLDLSRGTGTVNLSTYGFLRIKITTPTAVFGPLTVDVRGASPTSTTPEEIVTKINTAFLALPGWPSATYGPAKLVARGGGGKYLQIVSGATDAPATGPAAAVELSGLDFGGTLGVNFLVDDAITITMGLTRGENGKLFTRTPHVFRGSDFTNAFIRGIGNRSGAGIGMWGPALESSIDIPTAGAVDGEIRVAKDTGIPWIYREGANGFSGSGWRRATPGYEYPVAYDKASERYRLLSTTDTFVPQPLSRVSYSSLNSAQVYDQNNTLTGKVGDAVALTDGRDFQWLEGNYTAGRSPFDTAAIFDNFPVARSTLGRSREGAKWLVNDANTPPANRIRPVSGGYASTTIAGASSFSAIKAYLDGTGMVRYQTWTGLQSSITFTIPDVSVSAPIKPSSFSCHFVGRNGDPAVVIVAGSYDSYRGYDDGIVGGGGAFGIVGIGFTGTVHPTTGAVTLTFPVSNVDGSVYKIQYSYAQSDLNIVAVDVRKDPSFEVRSGGTVAEAGVIYAASSNNSTFDTSSGFAVVVRDDGTGTIYSMSSGGGVVPATGSLITSSFIVDPPLDTTWRTLRILYTSDGSNMIHSVFWDGSNKPCDWISKDYAAAGVNLSPSQTNGGTEIERSSKLLAQIIVPGTSDPNRLGHYGGIWAKGAAAGSGYIEKVVNFRNFQNHTGHLRSFLDPIPALPPVSAVRLRDTINAVSLQKNGTDVTTSGKVDVVTDCSASTPLVLNLGYDLATTSAINPSTRRIDLNLDVPFVLATRDPRYLAAPTLVPGNAGYLGINSGGNDQVNTTGRVAYWSLSQVLVTTSGAGYIAAAKGDPFKFIECSPTGIGATVSAGTSNAYWNPAQSGVPDFSPGQNVIYQSDHNYAIVIPFVTYLPHSEGSIKWQYHVQRATVGHQFAPTLAASGFLSTVGGAWAPTDVYNVPSIIRVNYNASASNSAGWAVFYVTISYNGPVRPVSMHLDIMATRIGTTT